MHVVKAAEPVFAAALSAIILGAVSAFPVYLSVNNISKVRGLHIRNT